MADDLAPQDLLLAEQAARIAEAAREAAAWVADARATSAQVAAEGAALTHLANAVENDSLKLARAARRRMCIGVFGPSQAGKSYLVSALARRPPMPLHARFGTETHDFLKEINPPGDRESTGLVTRFSIEEVAGDERHPVALRLLTETDIVKILANSYLADFDRDNLEFVVPGADHVRALVAELEDEAAATAAAHLPAVAIHDLEDYFDRLYAAPTRYLQTCGFWEAAARLLPRLALERRARLFAVLWGGIPAFTDVFVRLVRGLERLAFSAEAYCGMNALVPRTASIIDVLTLDRLGTPEDDRDTVSVMVRDAGRPTITTDLPRGLLAGLVAEIRVTLAEQAWDFFRVTDLLDFPGARSRLRLRRFDTQALLESDQPNPVRELLLRGKVAYLFQRYADERELTAMLLCIAPGAQEVKDLGAMVLDWIRSTHGATPLARRGQKNPLLLVLTKFDREFEEKVGEDVESRRGRWDRRLGASLIELFGKDEWPNDWDGQPFCNSFWLRNPGIRQPSLIAYADETDGALVERAVAPEAVERIAGLKADFVRSGLVRAHFADPPTAWDAAFAPNDGGVRYIADALTRVCDPDLKRRQLAQRIVEQSSRFAASFERFHAVDAAEAREKRLRTARETASGLAACMERRRFGALIERLQVQEDDLRDLYLSVAALRLEAADGNSGHAPSTPVDDLFAELGLETPTRTAPVAARADRPARFASEAINLWTRDQRHLAENRRLLGWLLIDPRTITNLTREVTLAAWRCQLEERLAAAVRAENQFANAKWEDLAERQIRIAATLINGFIDWPGHVAATAVATQAPDPPVPRDGAGAPLPPLSDRGEPTEKAFYADWLRRFLRLAEGNVGYDETQQITPAQNAALGRLLAKAGAPAR